MSDDENMRLPRGYAVASEQHEDGDRCETRWKWCVRQRDEDCNEWVREFGNGYPMRDAATAIAEVWRDALERWVKLAAQLGLHISPRRGDQSDARLCLQKPPSAGPVIDLWTTGRFSLGGPMAGRPMLVQLLQDAGLIRGVSRKLTAGEWDLPLRTGP